MKCTAGSYFWSRMIVILFLAATYTAATEADLTEENRCGSGSLVECVPSILNRAFCLNNGICCMYRETGLQLCQCTPGFTGRRCQGRHIRKRRQVASTPRGNQRSNTHSAYSGAPLNSSPVAVFRSAFQRDTYQTAVASYAIDGNTNTASCTSTTYAHSWWAVELVQPSRIRGLKLTNLPQRDQAYRLNNLYVWLSNTKPTVGQHMSLPLGSYMFCAQYNGTVAPGAAAYATCRSSVVPFKYVIIQSSLRTPDAVCLCEVEVYVETVEVAASLGAIQRDTYQTAIANLAIDRNTNTLSCTSMSFAHPWWAAELVQQSRVLGIKLINEPGPNRAYRLNNFYVWLSNTKPVVGQPLRASSYVSCAQYNGTLAPGGVAYVTCGSSVTQPYKYVIVQSSMTTPDAICIAEVEVYIGARNQTTGSTATCGQPAIRPSVSQRVVGGVEAVPHSWPWMVSLQADYRVWCGGSLISDRWVVSAAHCFEGLRNARLKHALIGLHSQTAPDRYAVRVDIARVIQSPYYGTPQQLSNDVMLIELARPVTFNEAVSPVCLPSPTATLAGGRRCYATGWGNTRAGGRPADRLQQVELPIIDTNVCNQPWWYNGIVDSTMFCAGYEQGVHATCQGDSGGPLVCQENDRWVLYGATSWGMICADVRKPGVYARLSLHLSWINQMTRATSTTG